MEEDTEKGEFVTEAELGVLRALWRTFIDGGEEREALAEGADAPLSMVERVEAMLFPGGM